MKIRKFELKKFPTSLVFILGILCGIGISSTPLIKNLVADYQSKMSSNKQVTMPSPIPSPSPTPSPSSSPTPTPRPIPAPVVNKTSNPSDRALKVAGTMYALYTEEVWREKIRGLAGIPKSNEDAEIIQLGLWLDKNPGYLAKVEAAIEEYKLQQSKSQIYTPPSLPAQNNLQPLNCTSNTIGSYTYTNCY